MNNSFTITTRGTLDPRDGLLREVCLLHECPVHPDGCPGILFCIVADTVQEVHDGHEWTLSVYSLEAAEWARENLIDPERA